MTAETRRPRDFGLLTCPDENHIRTLVRDNEGPEVTDARLQAVTLLRDGRYRKAFEKWMEVKKSGTPGVPDLNGVGIVLASQGQWKRAARMFNRAHKMAPDDAMTRNNRIVALMNTQTPDDLVTLVGRPDSGISYELGTIIMQRFATSDAPQKRPMLRKRVHGFRQLLRIMNRPMDRKQVASYIFANTHHPKRPWREKALDESSDKEVRRWVRWNGLDRLEQYNADGTGVILLHSHFAAQRVATILMAKRGITMHSLEYRQRLADFGIRGAESVTVYELADQTEFALREVYLAQKALKQGSNLKIAGDGVQGKSAVTLDFLGKPRVFKSGFAELALLSGAPVLPVFCSVEFSGQIRIDILPALVAGEQSTPREERVEGLIRQYAGLLEQRWRADPSNITYDHVQKFLALK